MSEDWRNNLKAYPEGCQDPHEYYKRGYFPPLEVEEAYYKKRSEENRIYYNKILDEQEAREAAEKRRKSKEFWSSPKNQALGCFISLPTVMFAIVLLFCLYWFIALISGQGAATFLTLFTFVAAIALLVYLVKRHPPS